LLALLSPYIGLTHSCQTPDNLPGSCVSLYSCPSLVALIRSPPISPETRAHLRASRCGWSGRAPNVCCPTVDMGDCGPPYHRRVVGGTAVRQGAWPWVVALGYTNPQGGYSYLCGGALISSQHVLTAAHCVNGNLRTVLVGEHILENDNDGANPEEINVSLSTKHPRYNRRSYNNDIAVLKLQRPVGWRPDVRSICLPSRAPVLANPAGRNVTMIGWGAIRFNGPTSNTLLKGHVTVIERQDCIERMAAFRNIRITNKKLCARDLNNRVDACQGDSGGPLMSFASGRWNIIGVVSFGYKCAVPGFPGVYTRVSEYEDWIMSTLSL